MGFELIVSLILAVMCMLQIGNTVDIHQTRNNVDDLSSCLYEIREILKDIKNQTAR